MIEIKMGSPNANPVNPNKNNIRLDYTVEVEKKSTFETKARELFELSLRAIRETQALISCELSSTGDSHNKTASQSGDSRMYQ